MTTVRLQPIKRDDRIVFVDRERCYSLRGYVRFTAYRDGGELYIDYFEVWEPFRGVGYGREMWDWVEEYARRRGMKRIILTPYNSAVGFWRKMGFRSLSRQAYEMVKVLS